MSIPRLVLAAAVCAGVSLEPAFCGRPMASSGRATSRASFRVPEQKSYVAPPDSLGGPLPFDVAAMFRMRVASDGSTRDIHVLEVRPAEEAVREPVPPVVAARAVEAGADTLRRWRYAEMPGETYLRVSLTFSQAAVVNLKPRRIVAVEACVAPEELQQRSVVPFAASISRADLLGSVSILGGLNHLEEAAKVLLRQWHFAHVAEGVRIRSVMRFYPLNCRWNDQVG